MNSFRVPDTGALRLKLTTSDRTFLVGNFGSFSGAKRFAHELIGTCWRGGYHGISMPVPHNDRQSLELERDHELPSLLATLRAKLAATNPKNKTRPEMIEWQIRRAQKRMACRGEAG